MAASNTVPSCPVCFEVLANTFVIGCGHALCGECFGRVRRLSQPACPMCRAKSLRVAVRSFDLDAVAASAFLGSGGTQEALDTRMASCKAAVAGGADGGGSSGTGSTSLDVDGRTAVEDMYTQVLNTLRERPVDSTNDFMLGMYRTCAFRNLFMLMCADDDTIPFHLFREHLQEPLYQSLYAINTDETVLALKILCFIAAHGTSHQLDLNAWGACDGVFNLLLNTFEPLSFQRTFIVNTSIRNHIRRLCKQFILTHIEYHPEHFHSVSKDPNTYRNQNLLNNCSEVLIAFATSGDDCMRVVRQTQKFLPIVHQSYYMFDDERVETFIELFFKDMSEQEVVLSVSDTIHIFFKDSLEKSLEPLNTIIMKDETFAFAHIIVSKYKDYLEGFARRIFSKVQPNVTVYSNFVTLVSELATRTCWVSASLVRRILRMFRSHPLMHVSCLDYVEIAVTQNPDDVSPVIVKEFQNNWETLLDFFIQRDGSATLEGVLNCTPFDQDVVCQCIRQMDPDCKQLMMDLVLDLEPSSRTSRILQDRALMDSFKADLPAMNEPYKELAEYTLQKWCDTLEVLNNK